MKTLCLLLALLLPGSVMAEGVLTPAANPPQPATVLLSSGIPFIKASSGTMGNNCAISAMTALPKTYSGGAYLYLPANAIEAGSAAGWYWFVGSSTTAGTCYNSTYSSGTPRVGTTTAFSTTGPGAFTGGTGAITAWTITLPANSLGVNGRVEGSFSWLQNNSGNNKTTAITFGAATWVTRTDTTTTGAAYHVAVSNRGKTNVQAFTGILATSAAAASSMALATDGAIDTTAAVTIASTQNAATATDYILFDTYRLVVYRMD